MLGSGEASTRTSPASRPADPDIIVQRAICFPPPSQAKHKTFQAKGIVLWTDAPIDGREVIARLEAAREYLQSAMEPRRPATARPCRPVGVAVYNRTEDYLALWPRVGAHYRGTFGTIRTDGYSCRVFCATSFGSAEEFRRRRPVICHEFAHVWLYQRYGLANDGNWLTEGLANAVQLRIFPDCGDRGDFVRWMEWGRMVPLKRLMDMKRIAPKDYWQAATLVEMLLVRYPDRVPAVVAAYSKGASGYAIAAGVLKTDFHTLTKQWAEHVRLSARKAETSPATAPTR